MKKKEILKNIHHSDGELPNLPDSFDIKQSRRYATKDEWCRQISQNTIIPALFYHYFGGDIQGSMCYHTFRNPTPISNWNDAIHSRVTVQLFLTLIFYYKNGK